MRGHFRIFANDCLAESQADTESLDLPMDLCLESLQEWSLHDRLSIDEPLLSLGACLSCTALTLLMLVVYLINGTTPRAAKCPNKEDEEVDSCLLVDYKDLPEHLQDNIAILHGYRANYSFAQCFKSLASLHNETLNIWSHLVGAFMYFVLFYSLWTSNTLILLPHTALPIDYYIISLYIFAATYSLVLSALFHAFKVHADIAVFQFVAKLDFSGISGLIIASFMTVVYYGLYCFHSLRRHYMAILALLGVAGLFIPWLAFFRQKKNRSLRVCFFLAIGGLSMVLLGHTCYLNRLDHHVFVPVMRYVAIEICIYLLGLLFYVNRWPESFFPGKFDFFMQSHQIWHWCVLFGTFLHFSCSLTLVRRRRRKGTCNRDPFKERYKNIY